MLRFISHLFKLNYETCKGCECYKHQLSLANSEKSELLKVILDIVKPKVELPTKDAVVLQPAIPRVGSWGRRRAALEEADRVQAQINANSKFAAHTDAETRESIEGLEKELKIAEGESNAR